MFGRKLTPQLPKHPKTGQNAQLTTNSLFLTCKTLPQSNLFALVSLLKRWHTSLVTFVKYPSGLVLFSVELLTLSIEGQLPITDYQLFIIKQIQALNQDKHWDFCVDTGPANSSTW